MHYSPSTQDTTDFPVLLENVMHKTLLDAYRNQPDTWRQWCRAGSVSDFRAHKRLRMGGFGNLDTVAENAQYTAKSIPDAEAEPITALTKGNLVTVTRQMIVNDDLDGFMRISSNLGRAAARSVEADAIALLVSNPTMSDTVALFHATHGNLASAGAITAANVGAARVKVRKQTEPGGSGEFIDLQIAELLCSVEGGDAARVLMSAEWDPDKSRTGTPNPVRNAATVVDSPRITSPSWYLLASADDAPVVEVAFLNGEQEPFMDQQDMFDYDGLTYKVRLDYGVAAIDFRGAVLVPLT